MEGGGGDSNSPFHRLHHLPGLPKWVPGGLRYGDRYPRGKNDSAGYGHEEGGTTRNLPGPAQGIQFLGQVQVPVYPGGIWHWAQGPTPPPQVLGAASDGGAGRRVLRRNLPQRERHETLRPTAAHHIKCDGGYSCPPLGVLGGRKIRGGQKQLR